MKKAGRIGTFLLLGLLMTSCAMDGSDMPKPVEKPMVLSELQGREWVEGCVKKFPEISWLADHDVRKTEEGYATDEGAYSEQLYGKKYIEFDRTIMTLHCLRLIIRGDDQAYHTFTAGQDPQCRLTRESFDALHDRVEKILDSKWGGLSRIEMTHAMETALVLGDIGKSEMARKVFKPFGVQAPDHDDFHGDAMRVLVENPHLCPSFATLSEEAKNLLVNTANLAHYGHITHFEGGKEMFSYLKTSGIATTDPIALDFDFMIHICDVAGAGGHIDRKSSKFYTELTHRALHESTWAAIKTLQDPEKRIMDAYNVGLRARASWVGLDATKSSDRVLIRIAAMLRLFTPQEGAILQEAMKNLDPQDRDLISRQLDVKESDSLGRTPTYIPAVLLNLSMNPSLGDDEKQRLSHAITLGLPFIAKVLQKHQELVDSGQISPDIPLNFNPIAGIAKSSPGLLRGDQFTINQDGSVNIECN